jgi:5-methylcytosine-specific restriction enzyme subunit McrC
VPLEEPLAGLRGQIRVAETIKTQSIPQGKLVCTYDEFTEDILHNQIIKSTFLLLIRHGNVKPVNKKLLRKLLLYFCNVSDIECQSVRWDAVKFHRNNSSYRMLINICYLVIKGLLQTTKEGEYQLSTWLQDEEMHRLYERFVLAYYRRHHPELHPAASYVEWDIPSYEDKGLLPTMKTDITLSNGERKLIIDTKYYGRTMQTNSMFNSTTFISSNIYQIFTYVKNSDKAGTGQVAGALLYAKTDETLTPDHEFTMGSSKISLRTLDLGCEWAKITAQLENLCKWFQGDICA